MYSPASGLGDGTSSTASDGDDGDEVWCFRYMAEQRPVSMLSGEERVSGFYGIQESDEKS